jgi:hypothetical protein
MLKIYSCNFIHINKYSEFVAKYYDIFGTGAIDWLAESELCDEFLIFETPIVVVFKEDANHDGDKYTINK